MVGDIVLLMEAEEARNKWPMGVIVETTTDNGDLVRKVGTRKLNQKGKRDDKLSVLEHPVQKLVLLLEST